MELAAGRDADRYTVVVRGLAAAIADPVPGQDTTLHDPSLNAE